MNDLLDWMQKETCRTLSLNEISKKAGLSPSHLISLFTRDTGVSPVAYHIRLRVRRACHLLDTTTYSIKEIASLTGYEDAYYFSRIFSKVMEISPKKYRQSQVG